MNISVEITETLSRTIRLKALSSEQAVEKIRQLYRKEIIVLDSNDFICVDFNIIQISKSFEKNEKEFQNE